MDIFFIQYLNLFYFFLVKKAKKGSATVKQRLGKILKMGKIYRG